MQALQLVPSISYHVMGPMKGTTAQSRTGRSGSLETPMRQVVGVVLESIRRSPKSSQRLRFLMPYAEVVFLLIILLCVEEKRRYYGGKIPLVVGS